MTGQLRDRVAIVTGAGRGIGREHALLFAAEGAKVVVNDLGGGVDGTGAGATPVQQVVDEIRAAGGEAVANGDDVSDFEGARRLVDQAVEAFGDLHVLVNDAGIVRDRMLVNMTADEWDAVVQVHLRGHFCPTRWAAAYWREQDKAGRPGKRAVVNTSSLSGLFGNVGQANYGAAKTGIATFSIIANVELRRYGVRVNAGAPSATTRLIGTIPGADDTDDAHDAAGEWSPSDSANVSPFVPWLAMVGRDGGEPPVPPLTLVGDFEVDGVMQPAPAPASAAPRPRSPRHPVPPATTPTRPSPTGASPATRSPICGRPAPSAERTEPPPTDGCGAVSRGRGRGGGGR